MPSNRYQNYAWFSVQVDQYYHIVTSFGINYTGLQFLCDNLGKLKDQFLPLSCPKMDTSAVDVRGFFILANSILARLGRTNIFASAAHPELDDVPTDLVNFCFYTCYCFQWTLFEGFVVQRVKDLADRNLLSDLIISELGKRERRTAAFFKYIDDGYVFGRLPFSTLLPCSEGSEKFSECNISDLNKIRELRNKFIHGTVSRSILPATIPQKQHLYERSMWILRLFAGNVDHEANLLEARA